MGVIVKKAVYNAGGVELVPNTEFWLGLPGLIRVCLFLFNFALVSCVLPVSQDGFVFVKNKITGAVGYSSL